MHILGLLASVVSCAAVILLLQTRHAHRPRVKPGLSDTSLRLLQRGRRAILQKLLNIGNFFGIDIGGSLTKLVFFMPDETLVRRLLSRLPPDQVAQSQARFAAISEVAKFILSQVSYGKTGVRDVHLSFEMPDLGGTFHFLRFETRRMLGALKLAKRHGLNNNMHSMCATGGGAIRVSVAPGSIGLSARATHFPCDSSLPDPCGTFWGSALTPSTRSAASSRDSDSSWCTCPPRRTHLPRRTARAPTRVPRAFRRRGERARTWLTAPWRGSRTRTCLSMSAAVSGEAWLPRCASAYPCVSLAAGVGFIVVRSESDWERVSGTSLGGGTYYGLCHMLTGMTSFDEMLNQAESGDNERVDLTVGDIYGEGRAVVWAGPRASACHVLLLQRPQAGTTRSLASSLRPSQREYAELQATGPQGWRRLAHVLLQELWQGHYVDAIAAATTVTAGLTGGSAGRGSGGRFG